MCYLRLNWTFTRPACAAGIYLKPLLSRVRSYLESCANSAKIPPKLLLKTAVGSCPQLAQAFYSMAKCDKSALFTKINPILLPFTLVYWCKVV